jgi:hypothetical protein
MLPRPLLQDGCPGQVTVSLAFFSHWSEKVEAARDGL